MVRKIGNAIVTGALLMSATPASAQEQWIRIGTAGNISLDYDEASVEDRGEGKRRVVVRITNNDGAELEGANTIVEDIEIFCSARTFVVNEAVALTPSGEVGARFPRGYRGVSPITGDDPEYAVMVRICPR
jgi:hypothetical protein